VLTRFARQFESGLVKVLFWTSRIGGVVLFLIAVTIFIDVMKRWVTGRPLIGIYESTQVALVLVTFFLLPTVQYYGRQLSVDVLYAHTHGRLAGLLRFVECFFSLCIFSALLFTTWDEFWKALFGRFLRRGMVEIPQTIPLGFMVFGSAILLLVVILFFLRAIRDVVTGQDASVPPREVTSDE
jgi:TRAP-type C4-dicarboxylate transport system permease small subunit